MRGKLRLSDSSFFAFACVVAAGGGAAIALWGFWVMLPAAVLAISLAAMRAWRRIGSNFEQIVQPAPNLILIVLPTLLASSSISLIGSVWATAALAAVVFWMRPVGGVLWSWSCAAMPVIGLAVALRPNYPSTTLNVLLFVLGSIVFARAVYLSESKSSALVSLSDGIGLFLVASTALWLVGFSRAQDRTAGLDNALTAGQRVIFPLSSSLAATPAMAAVYVAAALPILLVVRKRRIVRLVPLGCAFVILVLSGSRASLAGALFLTAFVLLAPRLFRASATWLIAATMTVPFIFGSIQSAVGQAVSAVGAITPGLIRSSDEAFTLSGRDFIWAQSLKFYDLTDWVRQMIGFGSFGHTESGASAYYYRNFGGFGRDDRLMTPHNSMLQMLFDGGWLTTAVFAIVIILIAFRLSRRASPVHLAGLSMLTALAIVGTTEVALSPSQAQPTWWILLALGIIAFSRDTDTTKVGSGGENAVDGALPNDVRKLQYQSSGGRDTV